MTLPFTVEFHSDEVPVSLASRLAAANGYANLKQFLAHVGLKAQAISEGEPAAIDHLSQLSGIAAADIGRFSLKRFKPYAQLIRRHQHPYAAEARCLSSPLPTLRR